ncbi:MAG TPA: nucleotidyl transferase AbiEii/AbiGii toxin family protein, partial [Dermatophilaceae bacterium]|nr:nucleotidyl transferase AbiEii/AbiGii toxin family protein [Dermatophilaceae bacterium]
MIPSPNSPQAFRRSLGDRIKRQAASGHRSTQQLQRQFLLQRFLVRVFADPSGPWVLKGGTGLLIRLPEARHSRDVDLLHTDGDIGTALKELRDLVGADVGDPLIFTLGS